MLPLFRPWRRSGASAAIVPGRNGKDTLRFPLPVPARLAVVDANIRADAGMKHFEAGDIRGLHEYAPEALVLPLCAALSFADRRMRGLLNLPSLTLAIVVLSSLDDAPLAVHHRDLLWKAFGLPVFEQLRGWDGRVIARECEVHDGLHFDGAAVMAELDSEELIVMGISTGLSAEIVLALCECGIETPRLRHLNKAKAHAAAA